MPRRVDNPPNPWQSRHVRYLEEAPPAATLEVYEEEARTILSQNDSPDVPFRYSVNPYRGCFHACAYCYARPSHEYLGFGAGTDFDRRIVVKTNAAGLLDDALRRGRARDEMLAFSGVTDCYQPLEASYELTRRCLELCLRYGQRVSVITKGALVERDADLLAALQRRAGARVYLSIAFADDAMARRLEPSAPAPSRRLRTLRTLALAGVPCGVAVAPIIPGLNDDQVPGILQAARAAGADRAFPVLLRLPSSVPDVFFARLREAEPLRADRVARAWQETRGGAPASAFHQRMRGRGPRWEMVEQLFLSQCRKLGLAVREDATETRDVAPTARQLDLFPPAPPHPNSKGRTQMRRPR